MAIPRRTVVAIASACRGREAAPPAVPPGAAVVGRLAGYTPAGRALVDVPGHEGAPLAARTVLAPDAAPPTGSPLLLGFENGNPNAPIILGVPREASREAAPTSPQPAVTAHRDLVVHAPRLELDVQHEILFRCGEASITLRADGTVVVRGTRLLSRSSGPNRIKGATVQIN